MEKAKGKIWIIFNSLTQQRSQPMSHQEMQLSLLTVKVKDLEALFIWTPGWENWQPLKAFLSSDQKYFTGVNSNKQVESIDINTVPNFEITSVKHFVAPDELTKTDIGITNPDIMHSEKKSAKQGLKASEEETKANSKFVKPKHKADLATLKDFRNQVDGKRASEKAAGHSKHEFTELVDPSQFDNPDKNEEYFKPDVDGDEILKNGTKVDMSKTHFDFELRPHERTYFKRAERHGFKIEVIIALSTGKTLRSFSRNISLTGTLIEDNIPEEFHNKNVEILLHNQLDKDNKASKLALQGKVVSQGGATRRLTFTNMSEKTMDKMEALLAVYFEKQSDILKKAG